MARNFNSSNPDFIDFGDVPNLDLTGDTVTLSIWMRIGTPNGEYKIFAKWSDAGGDFSYLLSITSADLAQFATFTGSTKIAVGTTALDDGEWHHIAGVYDGSDIRIYVDGVEEDSTATTGNMVSNTAPIRLGAGSGGAGTENPHDGDLGHAVLWDRPLLPVEIQSLSNGISPLALSRDGLLFYAPLNSPTVGPEVVSQDIGTLNGSTQVEEPPIPNSIVAR